MTAVLHGVGADLGQLGNLMTRRVGVSAGEGPAASTAGRWAAIDDRREPLRRHHLAGVPSVPRMSTSRRASLEVDRVGGGGT